NIFRGSVIDVSHETLTVSVIGDEKKIDAVRDMLEPFGIIEMARTGMIAMERGKYTIDEQTKERDEFNYGKNTQ
ncbi:MAG: acetolactate synthase small subunit, partial [Firmicutes bacterium]|nr:acetolactate synthase small subunit [Bacillota bacterium]